MGVFDFVEDAFDAAGDAVEAVVDAHVDAAVAVTNAHADAATAVVEVHVDAAVATAEAHAVVAETVATAHVDATVEMLTAADDLGVLDVVQTASLGAVNASFDDDGLSLDVGISGVAEAKVAVGDGGFATGVEALGQRADVHADRSGWGVEGEGGFDVDGLPHAEVGVGTDADGNLHVEADVQAWVPTYAGLVGIEADGYYRETEDGFEAGGSATASYIAPTGTKLAGGVHGSYEEDAHGHHTNLGLHGEVAQLGGPSVRGSVDYHAGRQDDVRYESGTVRGEVEVGGISVAAGGGVAIVDSPDGSSTTGFGGVEVRLGDVGVGAQSGGAIGSDGLVEREAGLTFDSDVDAGTVIGELLQTDD